MRVARSIIVCSLIFLLYPGSGWSGGEAGEKKKQLETLQRRIRSLQDTLGNLQVQKNSVQAELRENERLYGKIADALRRLNQEIAIQEERLHNVRMERDAKQREIFRLQSSLVRQIRATYAMGRQERLQLILNQQDPLKLARVLAYHDYFNKARVEQVKAFQELLEELRVSEQELLAGGERLNRLRKEKQAEAESLESSRQARKLLLAGLDRDYHDAASKLKTLKRDERRLQTLIESIEKAAKTLPFEAETRKSVFRLKGRLQWPVEGKLIQTYGSKTPSGRSNGVLIRAPEGEPVHAISAGRVVYADWLVHYGLLMIVDHGKGLMTLYAYNQSLYKSVGEIVKSGEEIAAVGRSGGRSSPALYFEVRKNGKPVNPAHWLKKIRQGRFGSTGSS